jgi:hypothetical protein
VCVCVCGLAPNLVCVGTIGRFNSTVCGAHCAHGFEAFPGWVSFA